MKTKIALAVVALMALSAPSFAQDADGSVSGAVATTIAASPTVPAATAPAATKTAPAASAQAVVAAPAAPAVTATPVSADTTAPETHFWSAWFKSDKAAQ